LAVVDRTWVKNTWVILRDAVGHFRADDGWAMASNVALSALMAVFPFVIFVTALAGFIGRQSLAQAVAAILFETWPADIARPIAADVQEVVMQAHVRLLTISALVAVVLAANGVEATRTALSRAYRVVDRRSIVFRMAQSIAFVLAGALASLALASVVVLTPDMIDRLVTRLPVLKPYIIEVTVVRYAVTAVVLVVVLVASHLWLPAGRPPWRQLWPGIVLTLVLWVISAVIFRIYLERFANLAATYAGLASVFTAIFFLYVVALSLIFGAEYNAALGRLRAGHIG
jgi:membrane protein